MKSTLSSIPIYLMSLLSIPMSKIAVCGRGWASVSIVCGEGERVAKGDRVRFWEDV